jgi:hypothetical protein
MSPEACRRKALEFQRAAEIATDESVQRAYRDLASKWHERAESAEALAQRLKGTGGVRFGPNSDRRNTRSR